MTLVTSLKKALDIGELNYRSHNSPTYGSPQQMISNHGISYVNAGENLSGHRYSPEEVVNAWMNSSGHRNNLLDKRWTHAGAGYSEKGNVCALMFIKR